MEKINAISIIGKGFSEIGNEVSKVVAATGVKPNYMVVDHDQHESMLGMDGNIKVKQGRVLKCKGLSVIVTL